MLVGYNSKNNEQPKYRGIQGAIVAESIYEKYIKRISDKMLSFMGITLLAPVYGIIAFAIFIDDPGPVLFKQKRVGKNKDYFMLHKFRSMKMATPHDVPTHQLEDPEKYITRVGKFLRKYSLDELPQIWDIFVGNMSIIGPRPALWNQDDLIVEREKYSANSVLPGLSGWAQINGRDELEIVEKAKLDGEYVEKLRQGGLKALFFDVNCFLRTFASVVRSDGVVEGGTGRFHSKNNIVLSKKKENLAEKKGSGRESQNGRLERSVNAADVGFEDYGHLKHFDIDLSKNNKKRVLITGAGSYIGESFKRWAEKYYPINFTIDTVDLLDDIWKEREFSSYDSVLHVAGIAHVDVEHADNKTKAKYYAVNRDLAMEIVRKAREEGVKQFVFMSSMIIYGESAPYRKEKVIDEYTIPQPANFYGDSKWQADKGVRSLASRNFYVAVLRLPMIYGKGSKGNYPVLAKFAKRLRIFPNVKNRRSMLHIDNLCEFLCKLILSGEGGVYFPQNGEYTETCEMVRLIGRAAGKKIWVTKLLNPVIMIGSYVPGKISGLVKKAFGNSVYSQKLSWYQGLSYRIRTLSESVLLTENESKKAVLILVNHDVVIYNFRFELVERLLADGYEVHISSPKGDHTQEIINLGAHFHEINIERHGMNPIAEIQIFYKYKELMALVKPMIVFTYTVKPNIYGGIVARMMNIPFIANITGLGTAVNGQGIKAALVLFLYKYGLQGAQKVFFQNNENRNYMLDKQIIMGKNEVLPGSGVNLDKHCFEIYPEESKKIIFTTIGRIMRDKGTDELLCAARKIKETYSAVTFRLIGFFDDNYEVKIREAEREGIIEYIEQQQDIHPWIKSTHAVIHPSYHEGMSNVLLEAAATGRPVLASDISGCRETFDEGISGFGFKAQEVDGLVKTIEKFIGLSYEQKVAMGMAGRKKMEQEFSRDIVVKKYMDEIDKLMGENTVYEIV